MDNKKAKQECRTRTSDIGIQHLYIMSPHRQKTRVLKKTGGIIQLKVITKNSMETKKSLAKTMSTVHWYPVDIPKVDISGVCENVMHNARTNGGILSDIDVDHPTIIYTPPSKRRRKRHPTRIPTSSSFFTIRFPLIQHRLQLVFAHTLLKEIRLGRQ